MKNDKLIPGLVLVCIGGIILLDNFGWIDFDWGDIWHLWPLFLIIAGVNLVFAHSHSALATVLKIGIVILGFVFLVAALGNFGGRFGSAQHYSWFHHHYHDNDDDNDNNNKDDDDDDDDTSGSKSIVKVEGSSSFNLPYAANAQYAQLSISGGGTSYNLSDTTSQLFKADTKEHFGKYEFTHSNNGSTYTLDFHMKDKKGAHFDWDTDDKSNSVDFRLNPNPIWDISVETGATALDFDLTKFKIRTVKLSGGAASLKVKLGQPLSSTNVEVSTGMASVEIDIPENAACRISTDSGLSSTDFDGFNKKDDGDYETTGFEAAKNKIYIHITGGLSDFNVNKY